MDLWNIHGARYYDPVLGRFITPDTIVQAPYDPQSLNRYAYCRNNPVKYVDPTGHSWWTKNVEEPIQEFIGQINDSIDSFLYEELGLPSNVHINVNVRTDIYSWGGSSGGNSGSGSNNTTDYGTGGNGGTSMPDTSGDIGIVDRRNPYSDIIFASSNVFHETYRLEDKEWRLTNKYKRVLGYTEGKWGKWYTISPSIPTSPKDLALGLSLQERRKSVDVNLITVYELERLYMDVEVYGIENRYEALDAPIETETMRFVKFTSEFSHYKYQQRVVLQLLMVINIPSPPGPVNW